MKGRAWKRQQSQDSAFPALTCHQTRTGRSTDRGILLFMCTEFSWERRSGWDQQVASLMEQIHSLFMCLMNHWVTDQQWAMEAVQTEGQPSGEVEQPPCSFEALLAPRGVREAWGLLPRVPRETGGEKRVLFLIGWWKSAHGTDQRAKYRSEGKENIWIKGWGKNRETGVCGEPCNNPHLGFRSSGRNQVGKVRKKWEKARLSIRGPIVSQRVHGTVAMLCRIKRQSWPFFVGFPCVAPGLSCEQNLTGFYTRIVYKGLWFSFFPHK